LAPRLTPGPRVRQTAGARVDFFLLTWPRVHLLSRHDGKGSDSVTWNAALAAAHGGIGNPTASSPLTYTSGSPADVIDGDDTTFGHTNYLAVEAILVAIDLGADHAISGIRLKTGHNDNHGWTESLFYSTTGTGGWTQAYTRSNSGGDTGLVALGAPVTARYWRLQGPMTDTGLGEQAILYTVELWTGDLIPGSGGSDGSTLTGSPAYSGDLEAWLSSSSTANLHKTDGLPWLTKTAVDAIKVITDKLGNQGAGSTDWITSLWKLAGDFTDAEYAAVKAWWRAASGQAATASGGGASWFTTGDGTVIGQAIDNLSGQVAGVAGSVTPKVMQAGVGALTPVDETDFTHQLAWAVPADVYVVQFTDWPGQKDVNDVAGVTWLPHIAWWAPLEGNQAGQRGFLDFEYNQAHRLPVRCEGILIEAKYVGVTGHVQAFVLP
jgi:F5/8 type C domain